MTYHTEGETPSSVDPDRLGEISVRVGVAARGFSQSFTEPETESETEFDTEFDTESDTESDTGSEFGVEGRPAVADSGRTRVNEKDKKPGAHCVMWVLSDKV